MTRYRPGNDAAQLARLIDRTPFTSAAGLSSNQKINFDRLPRSSSLYAWFIEQLGNWAAVQEIEVVTAVPDGANRFARDMARHRGLPLALYKKQSKRPVPHYQIRQGRDLLLKGARVGIVEDVRSTGYSTIRLARLIPGQLAACALIDRGEDVPDVRTVEESQAYAQAYPLAPPAHIETSFPYEAIKQYPLGLLSAESDTNT